MVPFTYGDRADPGLKDYETIHKADPFPQRPHAGVNCLLNLPHEAREHRTPLSGYA